MCFNPPDQPDPVQQTAKAEEGAQSLELGSEEFNRAGQTARSGLQLPGQTKAPASATGLKMPGT